MLKYLPSRLIIAVVLLCFGFGLVFFFLSIPSKPVFGTLGHNKDKIPLSQKHDLQITISPLNGTTFYSADPIMIEVVTTNVSHERVRLGADVDEDAGAFDFCAEQNGKKVPLTQFGEQQKVAVLSMGLQEVLWLAPNESIKHDIIINRFCDMTLGGLYSITIGRYVPNTLQLDEKHSVLYPSNTLSITVTNRATDYPFVR
jgi:hypothetical protein